MMQYRSGPNSIRGHDTLGQVYAAARTLNISRLSPGGYAAPGSKPKLDPKINHHSSQEPCRQEALPGVYLVLAIRLARRGVLVRRGAQEGRQAPHTRAPTPAQRLRRGAERRLLLPPSRIARGGHGPLGRLRSPWDASPSGASATKQSSCNKHRSLRASP